MEAKIIDECRKLINTADAILIGAGAGLTAAAGISYTDKAKFAELFPAWVKKGFTMVYELLGYSAWTEAEKWGCLAIHINYIYFQQHKLPVYEKLRNIIGNSDYFVITSNVDGLFHKNGFEPNRIYTPQGSFGKIQCTVPCSDEVWDIKPWFDKLMQALHPTGQYITDESCIPKCPKCGATMYLNTRIDHSFIDKPYLPERDRLVEWLKNLKDSNLLVLELGSGFNTPGVIRFPLENIVKSHKNARLIRVNLDYSNVPEAIRQKSISVNGNIDEFINNL